MKKYISKALTLIFLLLLTACGNSKNISLPEFVKITEIILEKNNSECSVKITNRNEIYKIIEDINKNTKYTGKECVNAQPVNID